MRILVTGSGGFIGTSVLECAQERGIDVTAMDLPDSILDRDCLAKKMEGVDAVIHLAARPGVQDSIAHPFQSFRTNVEGTHNVLGCASARRVRRVVFVSSAAADASMSPYGASKAAGEVYCKAYAESYGMQAVIARLSNVYGPHSAHKQTAVVRFIRQALAGEPLTVYGDGEQLRDFVWVGDVARRLVDLAVAPEATGVGPHRIGSGRMANINDLATQIELIHGCELRREYRPGCAGEIAVPESAPLDGAALDLKEGLRRTYDWFAQAKRHPETAGTVGCDSESGGDAVPGDSQSEEVAG